MAPRQTKRRDEWRLTKKGTWRISLGRRGQRVTLFQITKGGFFYREVFLPGGRKDRRSIGTNDREAAHKIGLQLLAAMISGSAPEPRKAVRLGEVIDAFLRESPMFLDNHEHTRKDSEARLVIIRSAIGGHREVRTLTENDVRQYEARRRAGGIPYGNGQVTGRVRQRSIQADMKLLKQTLSWACTRTTEDGSRWLEQNPLQYVRIRGEHDVKRPVASFERYEATRQQMLQFQRKYESQMEEAKGPKDRGRAEARRLSWVRAELGLFLLEATGRRRGAIMGLRWSDFDAAIGYVTWRAEYDKKGRTWKVPYPATFFETIRDFQKRLGAAGGFVFPRAEDSVEAAPPELLSQWIRKAEKRAGLPKLVGSTCHAYRRKWRSERPHHSLKAVMEAGGWSDVNTMLRCYDHPETSDVLAVTAETRKRKEGALG